MPLRLFNTLTKKKELFVPLEKGKASVYTCGPTVYGRPHIGNYASFLMADLLCRWLEVSGYEVAHAKNITDVGHLTADDVADAGGEDKIEKEARREKGGGGSDLAAEDVIAIARKYEKQFIEDEKALNMREPQYRPRATETIDEMIEIIGMLIGKELAYEAEDGVYFRVERFPDYGKLSGNTLSKLGKLQEGVRTEISAHKRNPADFALWKKRVGENAGHVLHWDSPWGDGFPGWHIECSAMSLKYLSDFLPAGRQESPIFLRPESARKWLIDIHTGGEDNIFPHHECEIAQTEGATGCRFAGYWLHKRRINFDNEKMSKSLGNVLSLSDVEERGFSPLDLRYFFLSSHYRSHMQFTWKGIEGARKARIRIVEWIREIAGDANGLSVGDTDMEEFTRKFEGAMNDDLNAPEALAVIFDAMSRSRKIRKRTRCKKCSGLSDFAGRFRKTFGCFEPAEEVGIPADVRRMIDEREQARGAGDYEKSDRLRAQIRGMGFILEDSEDGVEAVPVDRRF